MICRRVKHVAPKLSFDTDVFDSAETLEQLCLMSGGHVRNLLLLTQDAIGRTVDLPISKRAVQRAITQARDTYRRTVNHDQWRLLIVGDFELRFPPELGASGGENRLLHTSFLLCL